MPFILRYIGAHHPAVGYVCILLRTPQIGVSPDLMAFGGIQSQTALCSTELLLHFIMCNHGRDATRPDKNIAANPEAISCLFSSAHSYHFELGKIQ